jgi:hypothetical protein
MTDAYEAQGDFAPVQSDEFAIAGESFIQDTPALDVLDAVEAAPKLPNGFVRLGLAAELVAAVAVLGFEQPTTVQDKVIPLALGSTEEGDARFIDLMVSSQTGSGKTAAFLLPVLHTLLKQEAEAEAIAKAEFQRLAAQEGQAQGPDQHAQLQGRHTWRPDPVPDARTRAAGGP